MLVALAFGVALFIRTTLPYPQIFTDAGIKFSGVDSYYQMRIVDNIVRNFPHMMTFDPYMIYPGGAPIGSVHFFNWLLAAIAWLVGLGSPSARLVDTIAVFYPPVLAALTVIPVYFIGKQLINRWAGIIAAGLVAVLPGEFLGRSVLGHTDQHVAEVLFTTVIMAFLLLALAAARDSKLSLDHLGPREWARARRPLVLSLLAGVSLGLYLLTWLGALLFVFIIAAFFAIQFVVDHLRGRSTDYLGIVGGITFLVGLIMFVPASPSAFYTVPLVFALVLPPALSVLGRAMVSRRVRRAYFPLALAVLGLVGVGVLRLASPTLFSSMLAAVAFLVPSGTALTTLEMQPLSFAIIWGNFTVDFYVFLLALPFLAYPVIKRGEAEKTLVLVWSLVILLATIGQRRFGYYLAVNVAVLCGYLSWLALERLGFKTTPPPQVAASATRKGPRVQLRKRPRRGYNPEVPTRWVTRGLAVVVVFFVVFFWNIDPAIQNAKQAAFAITDAWVSSMKWLRAKSPEPFGDPNYYYTRYALPAEGQSFPYPDSAYGVLAWWDYGYYITRIGHRIPNANPSQAAGPVKNVAAFFTAQDEASADQIVKALGTEYVVIDFETPTYKFWAIAEWAGKSQTDFFDVYYFPREGQLQAAQVFFPEYYRSLAVRLYHFDGQEVRPTNTLVVTYEEKVTQDGQRYRQVTATKSFPTYEEATAFVASQKAGTTRIVSTDPFTSPVPLEALQHYRLAHSTNETTSKGLSGTIPTVKVFQYVP